MWRPVWETTSPSHNRRNSRDSRSGVRSRASPRIRAPARASREGIGAGASSRSSNMRAQGYRWVCGRSVGGLLLAVDLLFRLAQVPAGATVDVAVRAGAPEDHVVPAEAQHPELSALVPPEAEDDVRLVVSVEDVGKRRSRQILDAVHLVEAEPVRIVE